MPDRNERPSPSYRRITRIHLKPPFSTIAASAMYPSSLRIVAMAIFTLEWGMSVRWWRAPTALRMRVKRSEIGSFIVSSRGGARARRPRLPARFRHARHEAEQGQVPEADPAHLEAAHVRARPPAAPAAVAVADRELRLLPVRRPPGLGRHRLPSLSRGGTAGRGA